MKYKHKTSGNVVHAVHVDLKANAQSHRHTPFTHVSDSDIPKLQTLLGRWMGWSSGEHRDERGVTLLNDRQQAIYDVPHGSWLLLMQDSLVPMSDAPFRGTYEQLSADGGQLCYSDENFSIEVAAKAPVVADPAIANLYDAKHLFPRVDPLACAPWASDNDLVMAITRGDPGLLPRLTQVEEGEFFYAYTALRTKIQDRQGVLMMRITNPSRHGTEDISVKFRRTVRLSDIDLLDSPGNAQATTALFDTDFLAKRADFDEILNMMNNMFRSAGPTERIHFKVELQRFWFNQRRMNNELLEHPKYALLVAQTNGFKGNWREWILHLKASTGIVDEPIKLNTTVTPIPEILDVIDDEPPSEQQVVLNKLGKHYERMIERQINRYSHEVNRRGNLLADHGTVALGEHTGLDHLLEMIKLIGKDKRQSLTKKHRWIGYIQGILIAKGLTNVHDERNYTRGILKGA
jgi:hypothetical protein